MPCFKPESTKSRRKIVFRSFSIGNTFLATTSSCLWKITRDIQIETEKMTNYWPSYKKESYFHKIISADTKPSHLVVGYSFVISPPLKQKLSDAYTEIEYFNFFFWSPGLKQRPKIAIYTALSTKIFKIKNI